METGLITPDEFNKLDIDSQLKYLINISPNNYRLLFPFKYTRNKFILFIIGFVAIQILTRNSIGIYTFWCLTSYVGLFLSTSNLIDIRKISIYYDKYNKECDILWKLHTENWKVYNNNLNIQNQSIILQVK